MSQTGPTSTTQLQQNCISPRNFKRLFKKKLFLYKPGVSTLDFLSTTQVDQNTTDNVINVKFVRDEVLFDLCLDSNMDLAKSGQDAQYDHCNE